MRTKPSTARRKLTVEAANLLQNKAEELDSQAEEFRNAAQSAYALAHALQDDKATLATCRYLEGRLDYEYVNKAMREEGNWDVVAEALNLSKEG